MVLLQPERIIYWQTHRWDECVLRWRGSGGKRGEVLHYDLVEDCFAHLQGFEQHWLDWNVVPEQPFVKAARRFRVAYKINTTFPKYQVKLPCRSQVEATPNNGHYPAGSSQLACI